MATGTGAQWQNSALTRSGNQKPMLSASGVPAMHVGLDDDVPEGAVPEEEEKKRNQAYRSAPDDYADTGLVNSQRVNDMRTINQTPTPIPSESEPPDMYDPDSQRGADKIEAYYNMM